MCFVALSSHPRRTPLITTLFSVSTDGTQGESVTVSVDDKLKIARRLVAFGVDYVEAGWPGSNPKDGEFFQRSQTELNELERSKLVAFGSTRRKDVKDAAEDPQVQALLDSNAPTVCIVAKAHAGQVTEIIRTSLEENIKMIEDTVRCLVDHGRNVMVDMEHCFDGYQANAEYVLLCGRAAVDAGAQCLVLCDTNGGTMPWNVGYIAQEFRQRLPDVTIGIHCHNDCGMAVANSVTGCQNGVGLIQGTINGIGERTGNADLCSVIPTLAFHVETKMSCRENLPELTQLSRFVDELLNRSPNIAAPFVGMSAFAHKGGLHVAAMKRSPLSYQHVDPALVGNEQRVLVSELSGRQSILGKIQNSGLHMPDPSTASERAVAILDRVKRLEAAGYTFEGAEASVHLMILHSTRGYCPPFELLDYSVQVFDANIDSASRALKQFNNAGAPKSTRPTARATVKVRTITDNLINADYTVPFVDQLHVADGNGPVHALAEALEQSLITSHPYLEHIELVDYKVRILDPSSATAAATRVMIEFRDMAKDATWTTVSVDTNLISASLNALVDGFEYALIEQATTCMLCDDFFE